MTFKNRLMKPCLDILRATFIFLIMLGLSLPLPILAEPGKANTQSKTPHSLEERLRNADQFPVLLEEQDDPVQFAHALLLAVRAKRSAYEALGKKDENDQPAHVTVNVFHYQSEGDEKAKERLTQVMRILQHQGITLRTFTPSLAEMAKAVDGIEHIKVDPKRIEEVLKIHSHDAPPPQYNGWFAKALRGAGKAVSLGGLLLGMPKRMLTKFASWWYGQEYKPLSAFLFEKDPYDPSGSIVRLNAGMVKAQFWNAVISAMMIWVTNFMIGKTFFPDDPSHQFASMSDRDYHGLIHISTGVFLWVFFFLSLQGQVTAWKDQMIRLNFDSKAPPGEQIKIIPYEGFNFTVQFILENILNLAFVAMPFALNSLKDGLNEITYQNFQKMFFEALWVPFNALFAVFSFAVPMNLFGRMVNKAKLLGMQKDPKSQAEAAKLWFWNKVYNFLFWGITFSIFINTARLFGGAWSKVALMGLGTVGFGMKYGPALWRWMRKRPAENPQDMLSEEEMPAVQLETLPFPLNEGKSCSLFIIGSGNLVGSTTLNP